MLNQVVLVGRVKEEARVYGKEGDTKTVKVIVAIPKANKNEQGIYETDDLEITLFNGIADNFLQYIKVNDLIGIKGRLARYNGNTNIIADKVTFLSDSKRK